MKRFAPIPILLLLLAVVALQPPTRQSSNPPSTQLRPSGNSLDAFQQWDTHKRTADAAPAKEAIKLASARRDQMRELIISDPRRALEQAIGWKEYKELPEELKPFFETPFNGVGSLRVLPNCQDPDSGGADRVLELNGQSWQAAVYGRRLGQTSKEDTALRGITLNGQAAIAEYPFEILTSKDRDALADLPLGNPDPEHDFSTGTPLSSRRVTAIAGGRRFLFEKPSNIESLNHRLGALDERPGPHGGSNVVFELADGGGIDWEQAGELADQHASNWTETPKSVLFIRVDFPDKPGEVVSQSSLANILNTTVSDSIEEMSYGKTSLNASVSPTTIRMPNPSSYYLPSNNSGLRNDAVDAYEAVTGPGAAAGFDIVGVHFPSIGIKSSSGSSYAGLAGGSRQWLQGTTSSNVIIHEFGHNYGLGHASFWETSDGSIIGSGSSVEYGDPFDIMGSGPDPEGHFHMQAKSRLNWLSSNQWVDTSSSGSGSYRLHRFDDRLTTGTLRGLRITKASNPAEYYWVGYRAGIPGNPWLEDGAYLIWQRPDSNRSWLLDTTPGSPAEKEDSGLNLGSTYSDGPANIHITPTAAGGEGPNSWIDVTVQLGPFPANRNPLATLTAPSTADARSPVALGVGASDPDGDALAYSWDFGDGSSSENSSSTSHTWAVGGTYEVTVTVSDMKGGITQKSATVSVGDPLDNWTSGTIASGKSMRNVSYLEGRFLAGASNHLFYSIDGTNWTETHENNNLRPTGFASDGRRFVMAGYDWNGSNWYGQILHSADGRIWEEASLPLTPELRDVTYGAGVFVAVGDEGTLLLSSDSGRSWSSQSSPAGTSLKAISFGDGTFVAVGGTSVYTSTDGLIWSDRSGGTSLESWHSFRDVIFSNGSFFAGGWYSGVHASNDGGINWQAMSMNSPNDYDITAFAQSSSTLVATAEFKGDLSGPVLLVSEDGLSWSENLSAPILESEGVAYGSGVFLSVHGSDGGTQFSDPLSSTNGSPTATISASSTAAARTRVLFTSEASDPDGDEVILLWDFKDGTPLVKATSVNHSFPIGGSYSIDLIATDTRGGVSTTTHSITVSDPLANWTQLSSGTSARFRDIAQGGGKLVAVGGNSGNSGAYRISSDGVTWSGGTTGTNIRFTGVIHDGVQFVAAGYAYDFDTSSWVGALYTSETGSSWTRRHYSGPELQDIAHGNGNYVATGDAGSMWRSTNATSWSPVATGSSLDLNGVSFGDNGFVAVGSDSGGGPVVVLTSPDSVNWADQSPGAGTADWQGFYDVEFCGDRFLASGWYSKIRHSTDFGATFVTRESTTRQVPAFAYGNGVYFAAGIDKDNSDTAINLISTNGENWTALATPAQAKRQAAIFFNNRFFTVGESGEIWSSGSFSPPAAGGYDEWKAAQFPANPPLSEPEDDFDGDQIANLVEYATSSDPRDPASQPEFELSQIGGRLTLTIPKNPDASDVTFAADYSTDLKSWSPLGLTIVDDGATQFIIRITSTINNGPDQAFLRPSFELAP